MMKFATFSVVLWLCLNLMPAQPGFAGQEGLGGERIVFCMIQLEYADAGELAVVLEPFLSPAGTIATYGPTNTLIIRDRLSIVDQLSTVIKGKSCVAESNLE
jgi:hypothetical protein